MTISTIEVEYVATTKACQKMAWLQSFLGELEKKFDDCKLYSDSQSAIHIAKNSMFHSRTKHIDIKYHFVRSFLEDGKFSLEKIYTSENPADMLTKAVTFDKLKLCAISVGIGT